MSQAALPERFATVEALEDFMTTPSPQLVADLKAITGDILVLGVGGKMGPTLARMAKRALTAAGQHDRKVIGVARFSSPGDRAALETHGIATIKADLLDDAPVHDRNAIGQVECLFLIMRHEQRGNPGGIVDAP